MCWGFHEHDVIDQQNNRYLGRAVYAVANIQRKPRITIFHELQHLGDFAIFLMGYLAAAGV
jgi:hypothetical protein